MAGPAPWSAFPSATIVHNATIFAQVEGGVNQKLPRSTLLTAFAGEELALLGNVGGKIGIHENGFVQIFGGTGQGVQVACDGGFLGMGGGGLTLSIGTVGGTLTVSNHQNNHLALFENLVEILVQPGSTLTITFHPAHAGDWMGGVTDLLAAINRLARVVSNNGATPIP